MSDRPEAARQPASRHSLFLALLPPPALATRIVETMDPVCARLGLTGRMMEAQRLHLTLVWVAPEASAETVARLQALAARVEMPPVPVRLDRLGRFERGGGRPAPVVLLPSDPSDLPGLLALQRRLQDDVLAAGFPVRSMPRFQPHVTLLHDRRPVLPQPAGPFAWTAHEFVLVHSHVGERRYEFLGRWPLRAAPA